MPHRTSQSVPVIPFPVSQEATARLQPQLPPDPVPRWCVQRHAAVGKASVLIAAMDGDGYPFRVAMVEPPDADEEERYAWRRVEERRAAAEQRPLRRPPFLPFPGGSL